MQSVKTNLLEIQYKFLIALGWYIQLIHLFYTSIWSQIETPPCHSCKKKKKPRKPDNKTNELDRWYLTTFLMCVFLVFTFVLRDFLHQLVILGLLPLQVVFDHGLPDDSWSLILTCDLNQGTNIHFLILFSCSFSIVFLNQIIS